jgi:uncharacterized protein with PIN domain
MEIKLLLDTSAIIALLKENKKLKKATETADAIFISVISELEFKSLYSKRQPEPVCQPELVEGSLSLACPELVEGSKGCHPELSLPRACRRVEGLSS